MSSHSIKRMDNPGAPEQAKKRRKGATRLSCAECRRLKLRCDRTIPCGSCVKRGCGAICPEGSLTTGQGNRFVLASTQELHEKISELANRVRELEDGLRSSHSLVSSEKHPLLAEDLLKIKAPLQRDVPSLRSVTTNANKEEEQNPDVVDAFGSLSISISGHAKYFGKTANSWYFLQNESPEEEEPDDHFTNLQSILPSEILARSCAFPIAPTPHSSLEHQLTVRLQSLFWYLPQSDKAAELRSIYFKHAAWMYDPICAESFDADVYSQFYATNVVRPTDDPLFAHRLSLLFMVLAIGSLMDTRQPAYNIEAEKYHQLARAALFQNSLFDQPTINAVQSLFLMAFYLFLADRHGTGSGTRWAIMGIAVKVAQSIGLHRDSGRWKVEPVETQRRRQLFWELFTYDSWQCLTFGRPPSFALAHVDCKMPYSNEPSDDESFHAWKHHFSSECMSALHDQAFGAKAPTYPTVIQLERKMRQFPVPPVLQVPGFGSSESRPGGFPETTMLTLQRHIVLAIRESTLLYLHRSFFARAISDHPKDPLGSPYGTSVIAAYRSAGSLVALMRNLHTQLKEPTERIWFLWTHMFSCAIVLGSIVTRCPSISLAPSALVQLESACELFSKAAPGFRASKVLNIMLHLREKARLSLDDFRKGKGLPHGRQLSDPPTPDDDTDELSVLGGKTRLVAKKEPSSPQLYSRSPNLHHPVVPLPLSPTTESQMDPSVLEYLKTFAHQQQQQQQQQHPHPHHRQSHSSSSSISFSDIDTPVSVYGLSAIGGPYQSEPTSYIPQSQSQPQSLSLSQPQSQPLYHHQHHQQHHQGQTPSPTERQALQHQQQAIVSHDSTSFPQYFPVYDYGTGVLENGYSSTGVIDGNSGSGQRRSSGTPEANMQTTWQDFVAGFAVP